MGTFYKIIKNGECVDSGEEALGHYEEFTNERNSVPKSDLTFIYKGDFDSFLKNYPEVLNEPIAQVHISDHYTHSTLIGDKVIEQALEIANKLRNDNYYYYSGIVFNKAAQNQLKNRRKFSISKLLGIGA